MPIDEDTLRRLTEKYGTTIDLRANPEILSDILDEIATERRSPNAALLRGYYRSYWQGFHDPGCYDRNYSQYDKTVDFRMVNDLIDRARPELVERFDQDLVERYLSILDQLRKRHEV